MATVPGGSDLPSKITVCWGRSGVDSTLVWATQWTLSLSFVSSSFQSMAVVQWSSTYIGNDLLLVPSNVGKQVNGAFQQWEEEFVGFWWPVVPKKYAPRRGCTVVGDVNFDKEENIIRNFVLGMLKWKYGGDLISFPFFLFFCWMIDHHFPLVVCKCLCVGIWHTYIWVQVLMEADMSGIIWAGFFFYNNCL